MNWSARVIELPEDTKFTLMHSAIAQIGDSLFLFLAKKSKVMVYILNQLRSSEPMISKLNYLNEKRVGFALTVYAKSLIYLSGGYKRRGIVSNQVFVFDTLNLSWKEVPYMCFARSSHMSVTLGDKIYVISGEDGTDRGVCSIESHKACSEEGWSLLIQDDMLAYRYDPSISTISSSEVAVLGGFNPVEKMAFKEGYIFNAATNELKSMRSNMITY